MLALIKELPKSVSVVLVAMLIGVTTVLAADSRYVLASDFRDAYILDLAKEIRSVRKELAEETDPHLRARLQELIDEMLDKLCLKDRSHPYCKA